MPGLGADKGENVEVHRWWEGDSAERFWLEITDRSDIGTDLNAPQRRDDGREYWGYSLLCEVAEGDLVFHYAKRQHAIVAASLATGSFWEDEVVWAAHGTTAREAGIEPYRRPGWRRALEDFQSLAQPVTLAALRAAQGHIRTIFVDLGRHYGEPLYKPFEASTTRDLRPGQPYIAKLPRQVVALFPTLQGPAEERSRLLNDTRRPGQVAAVEIEEEFGADYRPADEEVGSRQRKAAEVDPALVERGERGHRRTQNLLARLVREQGLVPRSPRPNEQNYDIGWWEPGRVTVVEVKSITAENEERQLRIGLGQILRYRDLTQRHRPGVAVRAVLAAERQPSDGTWSSLCSDLDVILVWPQTMANLFS
jgi:hypothetical protein